MRNQQKVLSEPFNIEIHKETFINYLEVVILENGVIEYATPSHQLKLIQIACEKLKITRDQLNDLCPLEYYCDFMTWLCMITNCVAIWNEFLIGQPNEKQKQAIKELAEHGLFKGKY